MEIIGPKLDRADDCEAVLRSLPMWFGIERALLMYARDSATMTTFALSEGPRLVGFLTLREHFPDAWEIHCIAVRADARGQGHGSRLLAHAEAWLKGRGVQFLQVKTVAATSPSKEYGETREFYRRRGFTPIEVFPTLWDPHNPALQSIKVLNAA
jgi:GNAT superfamily N-acetyltransferase